jgi:uncharacterized Fe-S radical SAM superfamily protein PflX
MVKLQDEGRVHNINLVTPEHVVPQVVEALALAVDSGLSLPVIYNTRWGAAEPGVRRGSLPLAQPVGAGARSHAPTANPRPPPRPHPPPPPTPHPPPPTSHPPPPHPTPARSAYDSVASLRLLEGLVDIYLPDFKFWTCGSAEKYARAGDYPEAAKAAIREMHRQASARRPSGRRVAGRGRRQARVRRSRARRPSEHFSRHLTPQSPMRPPRQVGHLVFDPNGLAKRGVLVRHLVMPGLLEEGKSIVAWLAAELGRDTFLNIMPQYSPAAPMLATGEMRAR